MDHKIYLEKYIGLYMKSALAPWTPTQRFHCCGSPRKLPPSFTIRFARILEALLEPDSATGIARRMKLPRQTVNYHVRQLARARLLARAGRRKRRRMYEQCYVATAQGYIFSPELLGKSRPIPRRLLTIFRQRISWAWLPRYKELGRALELSDKAGKRLATLSINTEVASHPRSSARLHRGTQPRHRQCCWAAQLALCQCRRRAGLEMLPDSAGEGAN